MKNLITTFFLCFIFTRILGQACPPPATCADAPLFCGFSMQNEVFNNAVPIIPGAFDPLCGPNFTTHNSNWFRIVPCSPNLSLMINVLTTSNGDGLQTALYTDCNSASTVACNPGQEFGAFMPLVLSATVVPGQEYYLQIDGYSADICSYTITILSGIQTAPPPPPVLPFNGSITSAPAGPVFCGIGVAQFNADWPDCNTFQSPQLSCYEPKEDSCKGIKWTFPPGTIFIGDKYANPVTVSFQNVPPGNYIIKARPMDCACPDDLCPNCGQICCPVNEIEYPILITAPSLTVLPTIEVCAPEWPPACAQTVNGNQAICTVASDPVLCTATIQPYTLLPEVVNNIGVVTICDGDSVAVCDTVFTTSGVHTYQCSCDSTVTVTIIKDLSCGNDCVNYNFPAPPGDHCDAAPFLCGNYLDGYCTSNFGFDDDLISSFSITNGGFIRISPCADSVNLQIDVRNCQNNAGMQFWLVEDPCEAAAFYTFSSIFNNNTGNLMATGLQPDSTYFIVFAGVADDQCEFEFSVVGGIGTGTPGTEACVCTDGSITGPVDVCPGDIAVYTISPGSCTSTTVPGEPGNGYYCCPETTPADSLLLVWHIPPFMTFLSDSIDVLTITVQVNPNLIGIDTMAHDSVWISYEPSTPLPPGPVDSLVFCDCPTLAGCLPGIAPAPVFMHHYLEYELCVINCYEPVCYIDGVFYSAEGQYTVQTNCKTKFITILRDNYPPTINILPPPTLTCNNPTVTLTANGSNFSIKTWSGPGIPPGTTGNSITTSLPGTYTCTAFNPTNGCSSTKIVTVTQNIIQPGVAAGPNVTICTGETTTLTATSSTSGAVFNWSTGQAGSSVSVSPGATTTYTVTATNPVNGCTSTATVTVTVNPQQINQLGEIGQVTCLEPCVVFMGNTYCAPGTYQIVENACLIHEFMVGENLSPTPVNYPTVNLCEGMCFNFFGQNLCTTGTYTVEENCNLHIQPVVVSPPIQITASSTPIPCNGQTSTLSATASGGTGPITFQWDTNQSGPSIIVGPPATSTYFVTASDAQGCTAQESILLVVPPQLEVASITGSTICEGSASTLSTTADGGTPPYFYEWSTGDFTTTITVAPQQTTNYTVTVTDSNGCTTSTSATVTVHPSPVIAPIPNTTICEGASTVLTATTSAGTAPYLYNWSTGDITQTIAVTPGQTTNYTVTVTDSNGCTTSTSATVTVHPLPVIAPIPNTTICEGASTVLTATTSAGTAPYLYNWSTGDLAPMITVTPGQTTGYGVTVTDSNGCTTSTSATVTVNTLPDIAPIADVTICAGQSATLTTDATGGTAPYTWLWSNGETSSGITVSPASTTVFTVTVTDAKGCISSTSATVFVDPILIIQSGVVGHVSCSNPCFSFQGNTYCLPGQYILNENCTETRFEIAFAKDTVNAGVVGAITCAENCVSFQGQSFCQPGNYSVSDSCNVYLFSVTENLTPPACSSPSLNCLPGNNNYTVGFTITGTQPYKVNGSPIVGNYYLSEPVPNGQQYNFIVEQTINGCQALLTGVFDCAAMCTGESGVLSAATIAVCVDETATATVINPALPAPGQLAEFILHKGSASQPGDILMKNTSGVFAFDPAILQAENTYYISSVVGIPEGSGQIDMSDACTRISQGQPVVFHPHPLFVHISTESPACFGLNDGVITIDASGALPMAYSLNTGTWTESPVFEQLEAGVFTLGLRDGNNCAADSTVVLEQPDEIWIQLGPDLDIFQGEKVILTPQTNAENPVFNWSDDLSNIEVPGPTRTAQPTETTRYTCTVTDGNGCTAVASLVVKVKPQGLYTPNVITPETGEAINQKFTLFAAEGYAQQILSLEIFDRWGDAVFMQKNFPPNEPSYGWDGTNRGKKLRPDVFTFLAMVQLYDGSVKVVKGDVTVVR